MATKKKAAKKKKHYATASQNFLKASREKHLSGGFFVFAIRYSSFAVRRSADWLRPTRAAFANSERRTANSGCTKSSCPGPTNRARNAGIGLRWRMSEP
jgi:hypothetical protein